MSINRLKKTTPMDIEKYVRQAKELIKELKFASTPSIQRRLKVDPATAEKIMAELEKQKFVGPPIKGQTNREIL